MNILALLYGQTHRFPRQLRSCAKVARALTLNRKTVEAFALKFRNSGFDVSQALRVNRKGRVARPIVTSAIDEQLLETKQLKSMLHLTLSQRCELIRKRYNVQIKPGRLRYFYLRNRVGWRATQKQLFGEEADVEAMQARR